MAGHAAGVVSGKVGIQEGVAGANARANGTQPFGKPAAGSKRRAWRRDYSPRTAAVALEGAGFEPPAENRCRQGGYGREAEGGDDDDHGADCAEAENGNTRHFERKTSREERRE